MNISLSSYDYTIIIFYLALMIGIGFWFSRFKSNATDYLLGGGRMPWLPIGISIIMSLFSTYSIVMVPGEIYNYGLNLWVLALIIPYIQVVSVLIFTRFFFKIKAFTPFEYLEYRYDKYIRLIASIGYCYGNIVYMGIVLLSSAKIFEAGAGWPCWITICLMGGISLLYTALGGLKATVWTDVVQFVFMIFGLGAIVVTLCLLVDGGAWGAVTYAFQNGRGLDRFHEADFYGLNPYIRLSCWIILINYVMGGLGAGTEQMTVQRLISTGSTRQAVKAQLASSLLTTPLQLILWFIGLGVFSYYAQNPDPRVTSGDGALFTFTATRLPPLVPGIFIAAMLAAAMSTVSSLLNSGAAVWLKELYLRYWRPAAGNREQVRFSQGVTLALGGTAIGIALLQQFASVWFEQTMVEIQVIFSLIMVSVGILVYMFAIFSRKASMFSFWFMTVLVFGLKIVILIWYSCSKRYAVLFRQTGEPGLAGALEWHWLGYPAAAIVLSLVFRKFSSSRGWRLGWLLTAVTFAGASLGMLLWIAYSNTAPLDVPKVLSFKWVSFPPLLVSVVFMILWHIFGPEQPEEKYKGLILSDANGDFQKLKLNQEGTAE